MTQGFRCTLQIFCTSPLGGWDTPLLRYGAGIVTQPVLAPSGGQLCNMKNLKHQKISCLGPKKSKKFQPVPKLHHVLDFHNIGEFKFKKKGITLEPVGIFWIFLDLDNLFFDAWDVLCNKVGHQRALRLTLLLYQLRTSKGVCPSRPEGSAKKFEGCIWIHGSWRLIWDIKIENICWRTGSFWPKREKPIIEQKSAVCLHFSKF